MTQNQLRYQEYQETKRHNKATERLTSLANQEAARANVARETELNRHQRAAEFETSRSNLANEGIKLEQNDIAWGNLSELIRNNVMSLRETNRANVAREDETNRSNLAREEETSRVNTLNFISGVPGQTAALTNAETAQANYAETAKNNRFNRMLSVSNLATQQLNKFSGLNTVESALRGIGGSIIGKR